MFALITLFLATLVNASERVEWFKSNVYFPNTSDWTFLVTNVEECLCKAEYCYFPPGWQIQPNQSVVLFVHPFSLNAKFFQELYINEILVNPSFSLTWRIHPIPPPPYNNPNVVWPHIEFMWNNDSYYLDPSSLNASSEDFQTLNLSLSEYPLTYPLIRAGIKIQTNFRTFLISELHLISEVNSSSLSSLSSLSSENSSSSSLESSLISPSSRMESSIPPNSLMESSSSQVEMKESTMIFIIIVGLVCGFIALLIIVVGLLMLMAYCLDKRQKSRHVPFTDEDF